MSKINEYYLGLDMGTSSVGWAVTDPQYHLLRAKGKDLWGARLFDEASTAADRRTHRVARRRRQRQVAREGLLREYFADELNKVDPGFLVRLKESKYYREDRSEDNQQPFALFNDVDFTDKDYFSKYPTIFHLRKELIESKEPHDVRLVYLALLNMFKRRGNFLNDTLETEGDNANFVDAYAHFIECTESLELCMKRTEVADVEVEKILGQQGKSKSQIYEELASVLGITKKDKKEYELLKMLTGAKGKMATIFEDLIDDENKSLSLSFRDGNYEEQIQIVHDLVGDENIELLFAAKQVHDLGLLENIMAGSEYISFARVDSYNRHKHDLALLKGVLKRNDKDAYNEMFRVMSAGNYSAYVGSVNSDKGESGKDSKLRRDDAAGKQVAHSQEDFYKAVKKAVEPYKEDPEAKEILDKIANGDFMPKQLTSANGVIPNQVFVREMKAILKNASAYLPFLNEKDDSGLTTSERILKLFSFKIPYYVGPLGQKYVDDPKHNVWAVHKEAGPIYPWNFEDKIDVKASAQKFIERMVGHCTYLNDEQVLPRQALIYEKFAVLNELNNLKVNGEKISIETKQDIYHELFEKTGKKVTESSLMKYLKSHSLVTSDDDKVSGIDNGFNAYLSSVGKFRGVFGEDFDKESVRKMVENIILWAVTYGDDKKFLRARIRDNYDELQITDAQIKRICGMKFEGWGNLSKSFLCLEGASKEDGEIRPLITALWETNDNLMELLSQDRYTYSEELQKKIIKEEKPIRQWAIEDLEGMYLSAPVKRMVWQTIKIIDELERVIGCPPKKVFVEMTRSHDKDPKRTDSRKKKLMELYKHCKKDSRDWLGEIDKLDDSTLRAKKLYLYYMQKGICMYSGRPIDLSRLDDYDIDHIYPRHYIKDDNLENNLVLVERQLNIDKSDVVPIKSEIRTKMKPIWKSLNKCGFVSNEKYRRLTRNTAFTPEEQAAFVSRQLVETSQGTKAITQILREAFPDTKIVFSKAGLVSDFRKKYDLIKVRCVNDFHHANDAYLNIVVGNTYNVKFTDSPINFMRDAQKNPGDALYRYNMDKIFTWDVKRGNEVAWIAPKKDQDGPNSLDIVKKVMKRQTPLITRRSFIKHGSLTEKETICSAKKVASGNGYIPVKSSDERISNVARYGGKTGVSTAGYTLVEYKLNGKTIRSLEAIPCMLGPAEKLPKKVILDYVIAALEEENKGKKVTDVSIRIKVIPFRSLIKLNGYFYYLAGKTNKQIYLDNAVELKMSLMESTYIKEVEKYLIQEQRTKAVEESVSAECNMRMYKFLLDKYENQISKNKLGTTSESYKSGLEVFSLLTLEEQCYVLMQMINGFSIGNISQDLKLIGGAAKAGVNVMSKKINNNENVYLIEQSITGLFTNEVDLLSV